MNQIFFATKRAFHSTLNLTRRALKAMGLTAARLDMLYAIRGRDDRTQSGLRRELGVSATVVSRMSRALEALGLVTRRRAAADRRQIVIELTGEGQKRLSSAVDAFIHSGVVQLALDSVLAPQHWTEWGPCFEAMDTLGGYLDDVRRGLGDRSSLYYRWHPDD